MPSPLASTRPNDNLQIPETVDDAIVLIREAAQSGRAILTRGGGTKSSAGNNSAKDGIVLQTTKLSGIIEYDPGELTFTAKAGTPLAEIESTLSANGQYMPFDPPFAMFGATLGGTVAAGLSGPRRMRYGGLRDFVIGLQFINAAGEMVRGGGKVVKNAAGYDLPKLFCGSLGTLGLITEVSFKVFPRPQGHHTLLASLPDSKTAQQIMTAIQRSPLEVSAADLWAAGTIPDVPQLGGAYTLAVQLDGAIPSLMPRTDSLISMLPPGTPTNILDGAEESRLWENLRDLAWIGDAETVLRLYLPSNHLSELDTLLENEKAQRIFSVAGNIGWAALQGDPARLSSALEKLDARATVWRSPVPTREILPKIPGAAIVERIKRALDPQNVFYPGRYAIG
jgi:glycolate oxidase FAD binding subunit